MRLLLKIHRKFYFKQLKWTSLFGAKNCVAQYPCQDAWDCVPPPFSTQPPANAPGMWQRMVQALSFCHLHGRPRWCFQLLAFPWPNASNCRHLGCEPNHRSLSLSLLLPLCLCPSLSFKYINKAFFKTQIKYKYLLSLFSTNIFKYLPIYLGPFHSRCSWLLVSTYTALAVEEGVFLSFSVTLTFKINKPIKNKKQKSYAWMSKILS